MQAVISTARMREIDRLTTDRYGTPSLVLMENAATAVSRSVIDLCLGNVANRSILVLCGRGNNGGDGAAGARLLAIAGARVDLVLIGSIQQTKGVARTNFEKARDWKGETPSSLSEDNATVNPGVINFYQCESEKGWEQLLASTLTVPHDVTVDALFGTGLARPVEGAHKHAIEFLQRLRITAKSSSTIVSVDIPSGLNSDSWNVDGAAVQADVTVTMTAPKPANVLSPAAHHNGRLIVADIGSPAELIDDAKSQLFLIEESDAQRWLIRTRYTPESYKNTHGHAVVIAGSRGVTGAAALCGNAAMRSGAGLVTVATPVSAQPLIATQVMPEVMTAELAETDRGAVSDEAIDYVLKFVERADVIAIGPGLSHEDERTRNFVRAVVERRTTPVVIDADGLNCLAPWPSGLRGSREHPIVLTPHHGEMLRLMGVDDKFALNDRVSVARNFAATHDVILVLKGSRSLIASPDGRVLINPTGNAGLGTAGAGDTLTGIITGFLAQEFGAPGENANALDTVLAALYVSGLAGDLAARELGMRAMTASDVREHFSQAICLLDGEGELPSRL